MTPAELRIRAFGHALELRKAGEQVADTFARADTIVTWALAGQPLAHALVYDTPAQPVGSGQVAVAPQKAGQPRR